MSKALSFLALSNEHTVGYFKTQVSQKLFGVNSRYKLQIRSINIYGTPGKCCWDLNRYIHKRMALQYNRYNQTFYIKLYKDRLLFSKIIRLSISL